MPEKLQRQTAMYQQLADRLADDIANGEFAPGSKLPSETELIETYGVSRPTVRQAVAELRKMGLVVSEHGKGSFVRQQAIPASVLERTIYRVGKAYVRGETPFSDADGPSVDRESVTGQTATLLQRDDPCACFVVDRLMRDEDTGARATHRLVLPLDVVDEAPELENAPDTPPGKIYDHLAAAGHTLEWTETVTARNPLPEERTTLHMPESAPVLITYRLTLDADTGRPLLLEELAASADSTALTFRLTATKPPKTAK
jgi:GntR family transcriptional regulator